MERNTLKLLKEFWCDTAAFIFISTHLFYLNGLIYLYTPNKTND